jgi:uncharacterized protein YndB with AHSA1/START domain
VSVDIRSDRRFDFDLERASVWAAIARVDRYRQWWPWLRAFDGAALRAGERWQCVVKPPLPYELRFDVLLIEVVDRSLVSARVVGDIAGWAQLTAVDHGSGSQVRLVSELAAASRTLRVIARVARPVARFGHDWVLDTGAGQFRRVALEP